MALIEKTISQVLQEAVTEYGDELAIVSDLNDTRVSWRELDAISEQIAGNLWEKGIRKGDKVGLLLANIPEWLMIFFSCMKIGAIPVPINANFQEKEIVYILNRASCKAIFFQEEFRRNNLRKIITNIKKEACTNLQQYIYLGDRDTRFECFEDMTRSDDRYEKQEIVLDARDTAVILFTSGTTNFPKGVMLSHYSLVNNAIASKEALQMNKEDVICISAPLFHCFGLTASMLVATLAGATIALLKECTTKSLVETLSRFKCSVLHGVPTMFNSIMAFKDLEKYDISSLNKGIIAGAHYSPELYKEITSKLHMDYLMPSYGQTECSPACTMGDLEDSLEIRSTSVGKKLEDVDIRIVNPATKKVVSQGEKGELCIKGYNVMQGYCGQEEETRAVIDIDGWLHTGDLGYVDKDGNYYIVGRIKDIIIRGGENISPFEIEELMMQLDNINNCQVVGIPDKKYGEQVAACILVEDKNAIDEKAIKEYVASYLARYKVPKYIVVLDKIPMTTNGKVNKKKLKEIVSNQIYL